MTVRASMAAGREAGIALTTAITVAVAVARIPSAWPYLLVLAAGVGLTLVILASPAAAGLLLGLSLPELQDVTGGHLGGLHIAASDVVLVLIGLRIAADATPRGFAALRALKPIRVPALQYAWLIMVLLAFHPGLSSALKSAQRLELYALPLMVGAYLAVGGRHIWVLRGYILGVTTLAVVWPALDASGLAGQFQKNPTGQMIVGAILLLVAVPRLRRLIACMPLLIVGLGLTASRGAILALAVGLVAIVVTEAKHNRRILMTRVLAIILTGAILYPLLPSGIAARVTNFTGASGAAGSYAINIRFAFDRDAAQLIAAHPWSGIGVGNYLAGNAALGTQTTDPHNVILLEAAEGGYPFAASFIVLLLGGAVVIWRFRRAELAAAALAVVLATAAHGLVDVYWARGTPVLGWLLVGMVCGVIWSRREGGRSQWQRVAV